MLPTKDWLSQQVTGKVGSGRGLWFLCSSPAVPGISPQSKHGVMSPPAAGKPGQTPAPQTGSDDSAASRGSVALLHVETQQSTVSIPLTPCNPAHPSQAFLLSPKLTMPSL